ncbi:VOC family protein [Heliobacterium chlorum]|uniref:VOC family protein n=1 Tax=Heliobacterium chlorum TaxID=2698 RepID=A0ABR7T4I5_HELCL|nr:VOC family protein [Heliobacterium chlorum]MBC9785127.1 VOC family protein [Heliobacterium chlorum]
MAKLYPYIYSDDAKYQAEFYVKALDGEIIMLKTFAELPQQNAKMELIKDKVMHLRLKVAGQIFFMSDSVNEPVRRGNGLDLTLEFEREEEARKAFEGLADGGTVLMPFAKQFWGSMSGMVVDPFGIRWQIATEL